MISFFLIPKEEVKISPPAELQTPKKGSVIDELLESPSSSSEEEEKDPVLPLPDVDQADKKLQSSKDSLPDQRANSPIRSSGEEDWEVGTLQDRKMVWRRMLGNLWKYECRSIPLDKLDSRGHEFKRIFERRKNRLVGHPDEKMSEDEDFVEEMGKLGENGMNELDQEKVRESF
jgi:hypothetical protein